VSNNIDHQYITLHTRPKLSHLNFGSLLYYMSLLILDATPVRKF